jgi:hypothetical protein
MIVSPTPCSLPDITYNNYTLRFPWYFFDHLSLLLYKSIWKQLTSVHPQIDHDTYLQIFKIRKSCSKKKFEHHFLLLFFHHSGPRPTCHSVRPQILLIISHIVHFVDCLNLHSVTPISLAFIGRFFLYSSVN